MTELLVGEMLASMCVCGVSRCSVTVTDCRRPHFLNWSLLSNAEPLNVHPQQMDVAGRDLMVVSECNATKPGWRSLLLPSDSSIHKLLYWLYIPLRATSHSSKIITHV